MPCKYAKCTKKDALGVAKIFVVILYKFQEDFLHFFYQKNTQKVLTNPFLRGIIKTVKGTERNKNKTKRRNEKWKKDTILQR